MKLRALVVCFLPALVGIACSSSDDGGSPTEPSNPSGGLTLQSPAAEAQLTTLRPTLVVTNASGGQGTRTYEFQVSDDRNFPSGSSQVVQPVTGYVVSTGRASVTEGSGGTTSFAIETDLQPATRFYWRARYTQGSTTSDWSSVSTFKSQLIGFNKPGVLYDPLVGGNSIGTPVGSLSVVPNRGVQINDENAYIRYQLVQVISAGEFSMDIENLFPGLPESKPKLFSMMDGTGNLFNSDWLVSVQYRGGFDGNPDNCITFKAVFGDPDTAQFEPNRPQREAGVRQLNPNVTYHWRASWSNEFRVTVQEGGQGGPTIYDFGIPTGSERYTPPAHFVYVGANNGQFGEEDGSRYTAIYRNVWVGTVPRPASLGSALRPQ